jgi:hypothetical protein
MENCLFFTILRLIEEYAFRICETAITLNFIWVYGRMAIRHIREIERRDRLPAPKLRHRRGRIRASKATRGSPAYRIPREGRHVRRN